MQYHGKKNSAHKLNQKAVNDNLADDMDVVALDIGNEKIPDDLPADKREPSCRKRDVNREERDKAKPAKLDYEHQKRKTGNVELFYVNRAKSCHAEGGHGRKKSVDVIAR